MWSSARFRQAPPTAWKSDPEYHDVSGRRWSSMTRRVRSGSNTLGAPSAKGPSGRVVPSAGPTPFSRISSRLEPPRSPTTPFASGWPQITPSAAKRASSGPVRIRIFRPVSAFTRARKALPSAASRTAAVAAVVTSSARQPSSTARKRRRAPMAASTPSGERRPEAERSLPRPATTFSLYTVQRARPSTR